jgi:hypothetical protein
MDEGNFVTEPNQKFIPSEFLPPKLLYSTPAKAPIRFDNEVKVLIDRPTTEFNPGTDKFNPIAASKINWRDYDWPICCKVIHYNLNEIHPKIRSAFTLLYINFFFVMIILFVKCVCHFFLLPSNELNIVFVLTMCPILVVLKIQNFYSAYRGFFYDDSFKVIFKVTSVFFIVFAILNLSVGQFVFDGIERILMYSAGPEVDTFKMFMLIFEFSANGLFLIMEIIAVTMFLVYEKKYDN